MVLLLGATRRGTSSALQQQLAVRCSCPPLRRAFSSAPASGGVPLDLSEEVQDALATGKPVVALESAYVTHGLPLPHSHQLPARLDQVLRAMGVVPASVAVLGGRLKVGVEHSTLVSLAERGAQGSSASLWKVGRRELGAALLNKHVDAGTTVSATLAAARLAGISVFATGGIGGVHRGAGVSFDISSDLVALSDTPDMAVVCAGCKSILDIGLTLEYLETLAVTVAAYQTTRWPAFYTKDSGFSAPLTLDSAAHTARLIELNKRLGNKGSLLVGVPIPPEHEERGQVIQKAVDTAVRESIDQGIVNRGKEVTPWLLGRVASLTKGDSVISNLALIENNVKTGGEIAIELAKLRGYTAAKV